MRNKSVFRIKGSWLVICILLFAGAGQSLSAQNIKLPPEVDLLKYIDVDKNNSWVGSFIGPGIIRIWGWSKTGKIAYSIEDVGAYSGFMEVIFIIFDYVNDNTLLKIDVNALDIDNDEAVAQDLFNHIKNKISDALKTHNITEQYAEFLPFPIKKNNTAYNINISGFTSGEDMWGAIPITGYTVSVTAKGKTKIIMVNDYTRASKVYVCGYFISPFENRALIVLAEQTPPEFEGDVYLYLVFSGCHLDQGFN